MRNTSPVCQFAFGLIFSCLCLGSAAAATCGDATNVALASNGATATASSTYTGFAASGAINGDRKGLFVWQNGFWSTASAGFPAWLEVQFNGNKTITEIDIFTLQDNYNAPVEPTDAMTFSAYGLTGYEVQYWTGSTWATISGGTVSGNNRVWRKFTFAALTTTKVRVLASASTDSFSRLAEVEAWTGPSPAPRYNLAMGSTATASSSYSTGYGPSGATNGDRKSLNWGNNGGWNSAAPGFLFPDWLQVDLGATKTIAEIDVFTLQDNYATPVEPTESTTFTQFGLTSYEVQYWNGSTWVTVNGGNVTGNNKIWRKLVFLPVNTSKLRILTHASPDGYSRIMEVEAYEPEYNICGSVERLDPRNATGGGGENPISRNFNWKLPLVTLPGRAGMDLNLTLSYNSLVWTKIGTTSISFDDDHGFPSAGFRLGFPTIQPAYLNAVTGKWSYLLIGSDGGRTELRQVTPGSVYYEAADSSHLLLDTTDLASGDPKMLLRTTDGTQLTYKPKGVAYECTETKDRNGNYITINYNTAGRIANIKDTLERTVSFIYDNGLLMSIEQEWKQPGNPSTTITHTWASFAYTDVPIAANFAPGITLAGLPASNLQMLSKVTLDDNSTTPSENSRYEFEYTSWGQVWKISNFAADNHLLNYRSYDLPQDATNELTDCPRFSARRHWAENWNQNASGVEQEAITSFSDAQSGTASVPGQTDQSAKFVQVTNPDQTFTRIYFLGTSGNPDTGWRVGLPYLVDSYDVGGTSPQRQVMTIWTQDDESSAFILNPRVLETNVYDSAGNRKRTDIQYQSYPLGNGMTCQLPWDVREYDSADNVLRTTRTIYIDIENSPYMNRRIIGLPKESLLYEGVVSSSNLRAKHEFIYDEAWSIDGNDTPVQHDTDYSSSLVSGRGNLSTIKRFDVNSVSLSEFTSSTMKYNTAGSLVSSKDALAHETKISYADSFSDDVLRTTLAYPTKLTDPDGYYSTSKYNFDFGVITYQQAPPANYTGSPSEQPDGSVQSFEYYDHGPLKKQFNLVNNAYTRYVYEPNGITTHTYTTIQEGLGEAHSFVITDGAGRGIATATDHNFNTFSGRRWVYDVMGRVIKTSNPTETSASGIPSQWNTTGDDANAGWIYTEQTYDWKGRPLVTTHPSMTSNPAETTTKQFSYSGCGCAGSEVVTVTEEGTSQADGGVKKRQQKIYADVLGRRVKTEILNWDGAEPSGTNGTVYSATTFTYDARDQLTLVRHFGGPTSSSTFQDTTSSYDGFGRLKRQHLPEQQVDVNNSASTDYTTWNYNDDDTIKSVVDARGVVTSFAYNARRLPTLISFDSSSIPATSVVAATAAVEFTYDARGNRTSMSDGSGAVTYHYDQLSRMEWEERSFAGLPNAGVFRLNYEYNLGGILKKVTDVRSGTSFSETLDKLGRVTTVNAGFGTAETQFVSNAQYRAWGALKSRTQANTTLSLTYNRRLLPKSYSYGGGQMTYEYHNDGAVKFADDQSGGADIKDRAYSYDAAGRLEHAYSGVLARNFINNTTGGAPDGPYDHQYAYDQWGNMLEESGNFWSRTISTQDSYNAESNRNPLWSYDADGNILSRNEPATTEPPFLSARYQYDAAGREVGSTQTRSYIIDSILWTRVFVNTQTFDGDGQMTYYALRRNHTAINFPPSSYTDAEAYLLRSTVLGGSVISEYKGDGTWSRTHVYAGSERLGEQITNGVGTAQSILETLDPITGDGVKLSANGSAMGQTTMNPDGVDVGSADPFPPDGSGDPNGLTDGDLGKGVASLIPIEGFGARCMLDGLEIDCSRIRGNASAQCPNNDCGATLTFTARRNGHIVDRWLAPAPEGWDASYDGTYKPGWTKDEKRRVWRRAGPAPPSRQNNHASPQKLLTQDDPKTITSEGSKNCKFTISFEAGTFYNNNEDLPNGPGDVQYQAKTYFGLGFTVMGKTLTGGGIGRIGIHVNPSNPKGKWSLEQYTSNYSKQDGQFVRIDGRIQQGGPAWMDINLDGYHFATDWTNRFERYDHPALPRNPTTFKNQAFLIKVYKGNELCQAEFHIIQRGNTIHWGRGGQGRWPQ